MPHNDEVTLHAYLDGALGAPDSEEVRALEARLAGEPELRQRLDEIRAVRDRVDAILADSGPLEIVKPSFAEIQARAANRKAAAGTGGGAGDVSAAAQPPPPRRRRRFPVPLAWAATITVAVGAGWIARSVSGGFEPGTLTQVALESPALSSSADESADQPAGASEISLTEEALDTESSVALRGAPDASARANEVGGARRERTAEESVDELNARFENAPTVSAAEPVSVPPARQQFAGADDEAAEVEERKDDNQLAKMAAPTDAAVAGRIAQADMAEAEVAGEGQEVAAESAAPVDRRLAAGADREADQARDEVVMNQAAPKSAQMAEKSVIGPAAEVLSWHVRPSPPTPEAEATRVTTCYEVIEDGGLDILPERFGPAEGSIGYEWVSFGPDSVWISIVDGSRGLTVRLGADGTSYYGEARGFHAADGTDDPGVRGIVELTPVACGY